jgi:hypothetical protein
MPENTEIEKGTPDEVNPEAERVLDSIRDYTYVNTTFISSSNWDVRMAFCERVPSGEIVPRVSIVMPHSQAKAFSKVLSRQIERLEESIGEIHWEPKKKSKDVEGEEK